MTENEAIKRCDMLINGMSINNATNRAFEEDGKDYPTFATMKEFAQTCRKALEEIQQYRAIGTVEEIMDMLFSTEQEHDEVLKYRAIGTIDEFKALKEKNEPKKMLHNGANWYRCSNGCEIHKKQFEKDWYCPKCGQKLDWSE